MGNTDSRNSIDNSSEFFENANTQNQTGGNDQFNQFDIDLSILESESDFNQDRHGGFNNDQKGIWAAVMEFLYLHKEWELWESFSNNNGLFLPNYSIFFFIATYSYNYCNQDKCNYRT